MSAALEPVPGTADIWEPEVLDWVALESATRDVFGRYGYGELRVPIFERTEVFVRSLGDETDVVQKEMYTLEDRGGRSLTLRPEGTAGVMRAMALRGLPDGDERRVFYMGPMFRGERPAAGRRRQFHQIGVEAVGRCTPAADVECIAMLGHFLDASGIPDGRILLNTRGLPEDRAAVTAAVRSFFESRIHGMCGDCQRRLTGNVLRILDCKNEPCQDPIRAAPRMLDLVGTASRDFFLAVCDGLEKLGLKFEIEPRLVRGLDYYVHTVFEVVHAGLGAQDAIGGGGRYRITLPESSHAIEGVGFATGVERLLMARESRGVKAASAPPPDAYVVCLGRAALTAGLALAQDLRRSGYRVVAELAERSMKAQMRTANKLGAPLVLILGDSELAKGTVVCKDMKKSEQTEVARADLVAHLRQKIESGNT